MTDKALEQWIALQLVGIELLERSWPTVAAHVRLGVALGTAIHAGEASDSDYTYFETWHYSGKMWKPTPCWMR